MRISEAVNAAGRILRWQAASAGRSLASLARDRLLHFVLLGAALFGLNYYFEKQSQFSRITITADSIRGIANTYQLQYGRSPTPLQMQALVDNYIKSEIYYRQALKLGLDVDDVIIRRRLVQKFEFVQQDLSTPSEPSEFTLLQYYYHHLDRYVRPETVSFTHVYLSPDSYGETRAREATQAVAAELNRQRVSRPASLGDRFPGTYDHTAASHEDLVRAFGRKAFADTVFRVEIGSWSAPVRSGFGWHTVFVSERTARHQAPFDEVRQRVRFDYLEAERIRLNAEAFAKLRRDFEIVREQ